MNRRDFMKLAIAAGITISAAEQLATKAQAQTQTQTPSKGGRLRQALTGGGTGDVLDPAQTLDS
jgi:hypothetical protein